MCRVSLEDKWKIIIAHWKNSALNYYSSEPVHEYVCEGEHPRIHACHVWSGTAAESHTFIVVLDCSALCFSRPEFQFTQKNF